MTCTTYSVKHGQDAETEHCTGDDGHHGVATSDKGLQQTRKQDHHHRQPGGAIARPVLVTIDEARKKRVLWRTRVSSGQFAAVC